jgi:hypothetical protein
MRGRPTWLLLAALIGLAFVAAVDALRNGGGEATPEPATTRQVQAAPSPADELRAAGVSGTVYFTLRIDEGCELHALRLPSLQEAGSFVLDRCRFDVSSEGDIVSGDACPGHAVEVRVGSSARRLTGCAPAWKPNGELTFVQDGDLRTAAGGILVADIGRFAPGWYSGSSRVVVRELAWLTNERLVASVRSLRGGGADALLVLEGAERLPGSDVHAGASLSVSWARKEIFVSYPGAGVAVHDEEGLFISQNRFSLPDVAAVADSPDGRWLALARPDNVCIYEQRVPPPREPFPVTCLPFDVIDLAWR